MRRLGRMGLGLGVGLVPPQPVVSGGGGGGGSTDLQLRTDGSARLRTDGSRMLRAGGGGSPTPLVSADFKNGVYAIAGVSKTLADVWEENADWGTFDPAKVVSGQGLIGDSDNTANPSLTPAAFAVIPSAGFVVVATYNLAANGGAALVNMEIDDAPAFNSGWDWYARTDRTHPVAEDYNGETATSTIGTEGSHVLAALFSTTAPIALSVDGEAVAQSVNPAMMFAPTQLGLGPHGTYAGVTTLEKIEFFALADYAAADLPALSAP